MSATPSSDAVRRLTVGDIARMHADGQRIPMLTAYDYPTAKLLDEAGIPLILVGDSLGRAMLGYESEIPVTMADMLHHTAAVDPRREARPRDRRHAVPQLRHAGAGRRQRGPVPVGGRRPGGQGRGRRPHGADDRGARQGRHPDDGPHRLDAAGGERRGQGPGPRQEPGAGPGAPRTTRSRSRRRARSRSSSSSSRSSSRRRSRSGSGSRRSGSGRAPGCSGQVQVITDLLGWDSWHPKHAKPYADLRGTILAAARGLRGRRRRRHVPRARADRPDGRRRPRRGPRPVRIWTPGRPRSSRGSRSTATSEPVGRPPDRVASAA